MKQGIEHILDVVSDICDMEKETILSTDRTSPLPLIRGLFYYAIRRCNGYSNKHIAQATATQGHKYTTAGIGAAIVRAMDAISHEKIWSDKWKEIVERLDLKKEIENDNNISVTMVVPRGMKEKVRVEIKEKR